KNEHSRTAISNEIVLNFRHPLGPTHRRNLVFGIRDQRTIRKKEIPMPLSKRAAAEFFGTFWLVFGGCGSAVLAAGVHLGIGYVGVAFAFGLTLLTMAFAIGHVSGCHLNPAVSIGLVAGKRFPASELPAYIIAQLLGAICASAVLYLIASGNSTFSLAGGF